MRDRYPAGDVHLSGSFLDVHRDEIIAQIRKLEGDERKEHPLHRIMDIEERND
jgi:hypothetical protein